MQVKTLTFENEHAKATVVYTKLPTKEDLEDACITFLKNAMQEIKAGEKKNENKDH